MPLHVHCRGDVIADQEIDEASHPTAAAPVPSARPAIGARIRATAVLVVCVGSLAALCSFAWNHRVDASSFDARPVKIDETAWRSVLTVAATAKRGCPPSVPVVVLYVSRSCPHCLAELERWAALVGTGGPEIACTGLAVVAVPNRGSSSTEWLPPELASMLLWDHDGTVARALNVRLVPLAAYVTRQGVAVSRVVGEASDSLTRRHLLELHRISNGDGGPH